MYHTAGSAHLEGIDFAGKTGTAQQMSHEALEKTGKGKSTYPNVWFVGLTPRRNPELVVAVLWQKGEFSYYPGAHRRQSGGGIRGQKAAPGEQPAAAEGHAARRGGRRVDHARLAGWRKEHCGRAHSEWAFLC